MYGRPIEVHPTKTASNVLIVDPMVQKPKKKQHIVPVVYLKRFAIEKGQIYVLDKKALEKGTILVNIKDVPTRRYFYDLPEPILRLFQLSDPQIVESHLANWEALFGIVLKDLDHRIEAKLGLEKKLRIQLLHLVVLQYLRTEYSRKRITKLLSDYLTHKSPKAHSYIQTGKKVVPSENLRAALHTKIIELMGTKLVAKWDSLNMAIGVNESNRKLVTSDNPVSYIPGFPDDRVRANLPKYTQVLFPLSPFNLLVLYKGKSFDPSVQYIRLKDKDIICQNTWQLFQSTRHVISKDGDFRYLDQVDLKALGVLEERELFKPSKDDVAIDIVKSGDNYVDIICEGEVLRLHLKELPLENLGK